MSETLAPKQTLLLWCLLGKQGSALQSELVPRVGKDDREALIAARYLSAEKQGRSLRLTVTDKGWNWAGAHLRDPLPASFRVLQDWLARVDDHLGATGETLALFIGSPPETLKAHASKTRKSGQRPSPVSKTVKRTQSRSFSARARARALDASELRERIERAYLSITDGQKSKAVRLSALRGHLFDLDRTTVDTGLAAILRGDATARLSQLTDPKALNAAERAAAYSPAGEPFHVIWIEP